jgi:uncharacterized protein (TIGR02246 family)
MKKVTLWCLLVSSVLLRADVKGTPDDEQAIRRFIQDSATSTTDEKERDIQRTAALSEQNVAENVDFLNIFGGWIQGREKYANQTNTPEARAFFRGKTRDAMVESIRFLRPDVVIAIVRYWNARQDGKLTGEETRASFVLTKENNRWKLNAFHNTILQHGRGGNPPKP